MPKDTPATDALNAQGTLEPGTEGYWRVWGATVFDVKPGDLVMVGWRDDNGETGIDEWEVAASAPRGEGHELHDQIRPRFTSPAGDYFSIGALQPIHLLRRGRHHVLGDHVR
jgi:hypothetical protein